MSCVDTIDLCVIRGDSFKKDVGLSAAWVEVIDNPGDYQANLVFREFQDDEVAPYLTLTAPAELNTDPLLNEASVFFRFTADALQTSSLPQWDIVGYCELTVTGPNTSPERLFNTTVDVHD